MDEEVLVLYDYIEFISIGGSFFDMLTYGIAFVLIAGFLMFCVTSSIEVFKQIKNN